MSKLIANYWQMSSIGQPSPWVPKKTGIRHCEAPVKPHQVTVYGSHQILSAASLSCGSVRSVKLSGDCPGLERSAGWYTLISSAWRMSHKKLACRVDLRRTFEAGMMSLHSRSSFGDIPPLELISIPTGTKVDTCTSGYYCLTWMIYIGSRLSEEFVRMASCLRSSHGDRS